jgi:hypothetical protein
MANTAAHAGPLWGELTALTISQVNNKDREITVDRKVVEVSGHLYVETLKNRKLRWTIYPAGRPAVPLSPTRSPPASNKPRPSRTRAPTRWA